AFVTRKNMPEPQFTHEYLPIWEKLDRFADNIWTRLFFAALYTTIYIVFAPNMWWFLLLPIHFLMGPIQGAIVNWCGHKYGYANYKNDDHSKNSEPWGIFLLGELFQNNHHKQGTNPNFARKWFELDPTYQIMKLLNLTGIIRLNKLVVEVEEPIKEIGDVKKERVA
ncbi:MAG TPA: hypothetical protein PLQ65_09635, partial [Flavihumibacter sp.]|nr:hypothetical protein [Flavihumibacter sp.]